MIKRFLFSLFLLLSLNSFGQQVALVHINADFNKSNDWYGLTIVEGCNVYSGNLDKNPPLKNKHDITRVPTLILYVNGKEEERWEASLDMKIHADVKEVQKTIDRYK